MSELRDASKPSFPISQGDHLDTLAKGVAALRLFGDMKALSIQDTADQLQISRSAARRILVTLEHLGYLTLEERRYVLTAKVLDFGFAYFASRPLPEIARPVMRQLSHELGETVALATLEEGDAVFVERIQPPHAFHIDFDIGKRLAAYSFSVGQVLLAGLDEPALEEYLRTMPLRPVTPLTLTDPAELRTLIAQIRRDGYRLGINDMMYGVGGIAVPIRNRQGRILAGMVAPMFHGRDWDDMIARYLPAMLAAAAKISSFMVGDQDR